MLARDIKLQLNTTQISQPSKKQILTEVVNFEEEEKQLTAKMRQHCFAYDLRMGALLEERAKVGHTYNQ